MRRLGVELEMWLHEHPLNTGRERAGQLRVIGLWPWGAQPLRGAQTRAGSATLWGRDAIAAALWR
ncbi:hypothetical protein, partial [Streptomyces sp. P17]|uniref:hypothetical protein n=1 Tax=Streptomyces sp. P17 TaxID=3074716 RepID=UPI0028F4190E